MRLKLSQIPIVFLLFSCANEPNGANSDAPYAEYTVTAEEGNERATCLLRFFNKRNEAEAVPLKPPAEVRLDGALLKSDSAGLSGAYYEVQVPVLEFAGRHTIVFKNREGKEYRDTFDFQPFSIRVELGERVTRGDIAVPVDGLQATDAVRVLLTDTSFYTDDINDIVAVDAGRLLISREALRNVASGPVTLHLSKEEERTLKARPGGGRLTVTYSLSRAFELVD